MNPTDRILKVDVVGRVWRPGEQREAVLDEFERSGLPASKFAAHIGVKYPTFASWVQKRASGGAMVPGARAKSLPC
jgi:transposase